MANNPGKLQGKKALVTGGSSGMGLASAVLFVEQGADVIVTGRDPQRLEHARQLLWQAGADVADYVSPPHAERAQVEGERRKAKVIASDAGSLPAITAMLQEVQQTFGKLDIMFLNAGVANPAPFVSVTEDDFDGVFNTNFKGIFFTVQKAVPLLNPHASIILNTSIARNFGWDAFSVYAASKSALFSFMQSAAAALATPNKVRVNAISPGPIDTDGFGRLLRLDGEILDAARAHTATISPFGRLGTVQEIANTALFLASDDSSYISGTEIKVDSGISCLPK